MRYWPVGPSRLTGWTGTMRGLRWPPPRLLPLHLLQAASPKAAPHGIKTPVAVRLSSLPAMRVRRSRDRSLAPAPPP